MGGCFKSIGCLVVAIAIAAGAWFTRALWTPYLHRITQPLPSAPAPQPATWQPATPAGAARAEPPSRGSPLAQRSGLREHREPAISSRTSSSSSRTSFRRRRRTSKPWCSAISCSCAARSIPSDLGDLSQLGPLSQGARSGREPVQFGGTLDMCEARARASIACSRSASTTSRSRTR